MLVLNPQLIDPIKLLKLLLLLSVSACSGRSNVIDGPTRVSQVNLESYVGQWYALARIPNRFEEDCLQSEAYYSATEDPLVISVVNRCPTKDGSWKEVTGKGWIMDPPYNSKLKIGFFSILGWYPSFARGDYWIIALGPLNELGQYSYSVVGDSERKYGWILAREKSPAPEVLEQSVRDVIGQGYKIENFEFLGQ